MKRCPFYGAVAVASAVAFGALGARTALGETPKDCYKSAKAQLAAGRVQDAIADLQRCLALKAGDKGCRTLLQEAQRMRLVAILNELPLLPRFDLPGRRTLIQEALRLDASAKWASASLAENEREQAQVLLEARTYLDKAAKPDAPAGALNTLPESIVRYLPYLPDLRQLQAQAIDDLLRNVAFDAGPSGAYEEALQRIEPYGSKAAALTEELTTKANHRLADEVSRSTASNDLVAIANTLAHLQSLQRRLAPEAMSTMRAALLGAAVPLMRARIPSGFPLGNVASARVAQESLAGVAPGLSRVGGFPWPAVTGGQPPTLSTSIVVGAASGECNSTLEAEHLNDEVASSLPPALRLVDHDGALLFQVGEITCRVATSTADVQEMPSTYVASYQQVSNADYVRLQSELQVAFVELARADAQYTANPNFGTSFARGMAQGRVSRLRGELQNSPPFREIPVELPYMAFKTRAVRTATVSLAVKMRDVLNGKGDTTWVQESADGAAEGVRGVMEKDSKGLQDRAPSLPAPETLVTVASQKALQRLVDVLRTLSSRAFFARAVESQGNRKAIDTIGYLLLARDCHAKDDDPIDSLDGILESVHGSSLAEVAGLQVPTLAARREADIPPPPIDQPTAVRLTTIQKALSSVVTVQAGDKAGSGFFVSSRGLVITNAHVVDGAAKIVILTKEGESFLASIVKLVTASDLALLRVAARDTPALALASDELVPVGTDVIAVGSPLGLAGTVTRGILSAIRRKGPVILLQMDAPINPGNSGGPLLTEDGRVLGVNTSKISRDEAEGMGFAIAITEVRKAFGEFLGGS